MIFSPLFRACFSTFILWTFCFENSSAFFKQIFGAALMGDLDAATVAAFTCPNLGSHFTRFNLYTRTNPKEAFSLSTKNRLSLNNTGFNISVPTKIIIHGFLDSTQLSDWMTKMKNALLVEGNYNIIIMDWSCGNGFPYFKAVRNAKVAATHLHQLLLFLKERGANFTDFHLIGHSLGSQIAGIVGHRVHKLGRISALDPAGPMFYDVKLTERIDPSDALFVDVIHTDGGNNLFEGLGLSRNTGHVDFYPNGGQTQPGCHSSPFDAIERFGFRRSARYFLTCDHYRAINFYIDSIEQQISMRAKGHSCQYIGVKCHDWETFSEGKCVHCSTGGNCAIMGFYSNKYPLRIVNGTSTNVFYLKTSEDEPFCVYHYGIMMETGSRFALSQALNNYSNDAIILEVVTSDDSHVQLQLNEREEDYLLAGKNYTYVVTSKSRIQEIRSAAMWQGNGRKPQSRDSSRKSKIGVKIKKIEISPVDVHTEKLSRNLKLNSNKIVLCGDSDDILTRDEFLHLSPHLC